MTTFGFIFFIGFWLIVAGTAAKWIMFAIELLGEVFRAYRNAARRLRT